MTNPTPSQLKIFENELLANALKKFGFRFRRSLKVTAMTTAIAEGSSPLQDQAFAALIMRRLKLKHGAIAGAIYQTFLEDAKDEGNPAELGQNPPANGQKSPNSASLWNKKRSKSGRLHDPEGEGNGDFDAKNAESRDDWA